MPTTSWQTPSTASRCQSASTSLTELWPPISSALDLLPARQGHRLPPDALHAQTSRRRFCVALHDFAAARLTIHTPSCTYRGPLPGGHMGPDPPPSARPKPCEINDSLIAVRPAHMTLCLHVKTCHDPMCVTPGVSLSTRQLWLSTWVGGLAMATHKAVRLCCRPISTQQPRV